MPTIIKKNTDSSTISSTVQDHRISSGSTQFFNTQSGSAPEQPSEIQALITYLGQLGVMQSEINALKAELKEEKNKTTGFYQSLTKLSDIAQKAIWFLLIIPMLQLIACSAVVYYLGIQEDLPSLLTWVIGGVSFLSVAEMIILPIKFTTMENRMNEIERKLAENHSNQ